MTPLQPTVAQFVTAAFRAWNAAGIEFLVLRNYETLPDYTTNDIDVLVRPVVRRQAEEVLLAAAKDSGFRLHNRAEFATLALYFSVPQTTIQTHFDLFTDLKWRGFDFLSCEDFLSRRVARGSFAIPHPADEAATNLLATMIYTGKVKEKYKASILSGFRAEPKRVVELLARSYGSVHAQLLVRAVSAERWTEVEGATHALRKALIRRQFARPGRLFASLVTNAVRLGRRWLHPPGMTVVLCGVDGCGKSTASAALIEGLCATFSPLKGAQFHWKPPVFSAKRQAVRAPTTDPHGLPPRGALRSLLFFAIHWLEFWLGVWMLIRPITFRGGLVLIDRYYFDFFVDQRRYRLRIPSFLVSLGYGLLKKPDLVLLLDAPAEILQRRKQEVSSTETERQRTAYRTLVSGLANGLVIDAAQPIGLVASDIEIAILDWLALRTAREARRNL